MKRITIFVSGKVQEVKYRERVVSIAKKYMLTGNVQNLDDGRVKVIAEGTEDNLKLFVDAINIRNTLIVVENMEIEYSNATYDHDNFYKLVGEGETDSRLDTASEYLKKLIEVIVEFKEESNKKQDENTAILKENTAILKEFKEESNKKQDIMIEKQNENTAILKENTVILKENTTILKEFKEESNKKQDIMIENQSIIIEKQNENISTIKNESEKTRNEFGTKADMINSECINYIDINCKEIKEEISNLKTVLKKR